MSRGHLFTTHGDITTLACDAWLVPTDHRRILEEPWRSALPSALPASPSQWGDTGLRAQLGAPRTDAAPAAWLVNVGADPGRPIEWYLEGVRAFVAAAVGDLDGRPPAHGRARHLLALPLVGTRSGGMTHIKGTMVAALIAGLQELARGHEVDIALVLWTPAAFAAAQAVRRAALERRSDAEVGGEVGLPAALVAEARRIGQLAEAGRLVLFIGAGVSAGAGLPLWDEMLRWIALETGLPESDLAPFERLDPLDRAGVLQGRLLRQGQSLAGRVAALFAGRRPSLAHTLLASLPVNEIATTNYDQLFERASRGASRPVAVLPYESARVHPRWLLKLHGCISRPDDIVLTRGDYLRYDERRAALGGILEALLVTRHVLFVGFSLSDDNFHRVVHEVRKAAGMPAANAAARGEFGTALLLGRQTFLAELWQDEVRTLPMIDRAEDAEGRSQAARRLEVFLDLVAVLSTSSTAHLLDPTFDGVLTPEERAIRDALHALVQTVPESARGSAAWTRIRTFLRDLGGDPN
jgi:hypothetical protein